MVGLRPKTYSCSIDDSIEDKKVKRTNKWVIKQILKFNDYRNCLVNNENILRSLQRFESKVHNVCTKEIN